MTKTKIELKIIIDHISPNDDYNERTVERSLWIDDFLYTKNIAC
jgi:hypothetical protein